MLIAEIPICLFLVVIKSVACNKIRVWLYVICLYKLRFSMQGETWTSLHVIYSCTTFSIVWCFSGLCCLFLFTAISLLQDLNNNSFRKPVWHMAAFLLLRLPLLLIPLLLPPFIALFSALEGFTYTISLTVSLAETRSSQWIYPKRCIFYISVLELEAEIEFYFFKSSSSVVYITWMQIAVMPCLARTRYTWCSKLSLG